MKQTRSFSKMFLLISATLLYGFFGCSSQYKEGPTPVDRDSLILETLTQKIGARDMDSFVGSVADIDEAARDICGGKASQSLDPLRQAWEQAMYQYHRMKVSLYAPVSILEDVNPLSHIYLPFYSQGDARRTIRSQIREAHKAQELYTFPPNPTTHSARGLTVLENLLFSWFESPEDLKPQSGECIFLKYTTKALLTDSQELQEAWQTSVLTPLQSPSQKVDAKKVIQQFVDHIVQYTEHRLLEQGFEVPLGRIAEDSCIKSKRFPCHVKYVEHPFYPNRSIAWTAPLEVLQSLFLKDSSKDFSDPLFTFEDYIRFSSDFSGEKKTSNFNLNRILEITRSFPRGKAVSDLFDPSQDNTLVNEAIENLGSFVAWLNTDFLIEMSSVPKPIEGDGD